MTTQDRQSYVVNVRMNVEVTDLDKLTSWVNEHIETLPDITYSEEWTDPTDPDGDDPQPAYFSDAAVYLPTDPEAMLAIAAQCFSGLLPGVDVNDSDWDVGEKSQGVA